MTRTRPWYKEPMLWLVAAIPAAAVVAGIAMLVVALRAGPADSVRDKVSRTAQVQVADQAADEAALRMGLGGVLERDRDTGALALALDGAPIDADHLALYLAHPTDASADAELKLVRQGPQRWIGRLPAEGVAHDWLLEVTPDDRAWRLRGRLRANAAQATLRPGTSAGR